MLMMLEGFNTISPQQWRQQIQFELVGEDYNKSLLWEFCGINLKPFYTEEDMPIRPIQYLEHQNNISKTELDCCITSYAINGKWNISQKTDLQTLKGHLTPDTLLNIDMGVYESAGANMLQQLAYAMAIADEYIRFCGKKIVKYLQFKFNSSEHYFFELAKLQAIQNLWGMLLQEHQIPYCSVNIHTQTNLSQDVSSNDVQYYIRQIIAQVPTQAIKGAFYIEAITRQFTDKSSDIYKLIKTNGGFIRQLQKGTIQKKIKKDQEKKASIKPNIRKTEIIPIIPVLKTFKQLDSKTLSGLEVSTYTKEEHINLKGHSAGFPPFLRGISTTMYTRNLWELKKESDFDNMILIADDSFDIEKLLSRGLNEVKTLLEKGLTIEQSTERLVFSIKLNANHFEELAKLRAMRVLWAKLIKELNPKQHKAMAMKIHAEILGEGINKMLNTLTAIFGGVQTINTDKEINTYLLENTDIHKIIDPYGGSIFIEHKVLEIIRDNYKKIV